MQLDDIRTFCLSLPGVTEDMPWEDHFAYKVGGKMFTITNTSNPVTLSFKADSDSFADLVERDGVKPAPYLAKHKWVQVSDSHLLKPRELKACIKASYDLVLAKLPKRLQRELA